MPRLLHVVVPAHAHRFRLRHESDRERLVFSNPRSRGRLPVVLTGGCFQNARLAEGILAELSDGFAVYPHGQVPPGDGGIALGQAVVADAMAA